MGSERIMQAMARLERALGRIESLPLDIPAANNEPSPADIALRVQARETLQRLDGVIAELEGLQNG